MTIRNSTLPRGAGAALWLALACAPLAGCAHLPWSHRAVGALRAPRAAGPVHPGAPASAPPRDACALAARHMDADSLALAESELRGVLAREPDDAVALALLSKLLYRSGRHDEAVALLEPVTAQPAAYTNGARRALLAGLALHEDALGRPGDARGALAGARDAGRGPEPAAAVYLALRGDAPDSAAALAGDAMHRDGRSAVNLNNFGITRLRAGDLDAARRAFGAAIDRDPSLPGPYYNLAILEKFYRFDDTAAVRWFAAYWNRSHEDPDSLRAAFPSDLAAVPQPSGGRP